MISPELLRRYPFFGDLTPDQLNEVAMLAEEIIFEAGEEIFQEGKPAEAFYFLLDGNVDLYYTTGGQQPAARGILVGEINPGEPFGVSALIEPYLLTSTAVAATASRAIAIDSTQLRELFKKDLDLGYHLTHQAARAAIDRLYSTRVQLAAAWA